jgi:hypothetical protein
MSKEYFPLLTVMVGILGTVIVYSFDLYKKDSLMWNFPDSRRRTVGYILLASLTVFWIAYFMSGSKHG